MYKYLFIIILSLVLVLSACNSQKNLSAYVKSAQLMEKYPIFEQGSFCGSGGCRQINYTYIIINETVTSCTGAFIFSRETAVTTDCNTSTRNLLKMSSIQESLTNYTNLGYVLKDYNTVVCYYNITDAPAPENNDFQPSNLYICFDNQHHIVSYGGHGGYGGMSFDWHLDKYALNPEQISNFFQQN